MPRVLRVVGREHRVRRAMGATARVSEDPVHCAHGPLWGLKFLPRVCTTFENLFFRKIRLEETPKVCSQKPRSTCMETCAPTPGLVRQPCAQGGPWMGGRRGNDKAQREGWRCWGAGATPST